MRRQEILENLGFKIKFSNTKNKGQHGYCVAVKNNQTIIGKSVSDLFKKIK